MKEYSLYLIGFVCFLSLSLSASENIAGMFSGRVSKINPKASLIRFKIDFTNQRYVNKGDLIEVWRENIRERHCPGKVIGKSNHYLVIQLSDFEKCRKQIALNHGQYLKLYSQDLVNNLKVGRELRKILIQKHVALESLIHKAKVDLDTFMEKVDAVNGRYSVLKKKLEEEWKSEISSVEEDRMVAFNKLKRLEMDMNSLNLKMEQYKIEDENLKLDRWALDPRLYFKK